MSSTSPSTYLSWTVLSTLLEAFLIFHLWKFDRFKCLRWNNGPYSGAFKRFMTYSYLACIPCIWAFALGFTVMKYNQGYVYIPEYGSIPTPIADWPRQYRSAIFPLRLIFAIGWSLEIITHLEELCFWLFLVNASRSVQQDWFRSTYFQAWIGGSIVAAIYPSLIAILSRSNLEKGEAYLFLACSLGDLTLTLWFMPILWVFPSFLASLRENGVDLKTLVRLTKFSELNNMRVLFRYMFAIPLAILGADGVSSHPRINMNAFAVDFLTFIGALGCVLSSGMTLVIFFPRSLESEVVAKYPSVMQSMQHVSRQPSYFLPSSPVKDSTLPLSVERQATSAPPVQTKGDDNDSSEDEKPPSYMWREQSLPDRLSFHHPPSVHPRARAAQPPILSSPIETILSDPDLESQLPPRSESTTPMFAPNRRLASGAVVGGAVMVQPLTETNLQMHNEVAGVHPFVKNFRSPLDVMNGGNLHQRR